MKHIYLFTCILLLTISTSYAQEGLAKVRTDKLYGYIDTSGNFAIEPKFENARDFSEGLAAVEKDEKFGYINTSGEWVIQPTYNSAKPFNSGVALVNNDGIWEYINTKGDVIVFPVADKYYSFNDGVAFFKRNGKVGLVDTKGQVIIKPTYDAIKKFIDGYARVIKDDFWGMINTKGELVIPLEYQKIGDYNTNGIWGQLNKTYGVFNNFKFKPLPEVDKIWDFYKDSKITYAKKEDFIGYINNEGEWIIPPTFKKARAFNNGLAPVYQDKRWGYINMKGEVVIEYQFKDAEVFSENGLAPVKVKDWGFIDKTGKLVIPAKYAITAGLNFTQKFSEKGFNGHLARVKSDDGWGFINENGELLGNTWFKNAELFRK